MIARTFATEPFRITDITVAGDTVTVAWTSVPGRLYAVRATGDLGGFREELDDGIQGAADGNRTTFSETVPPGTVRRYYQVIEP